MNLLRLGMFIIAIVCFNSCKTLDVNKATKKLHIAGRPNLNNYLQYSFIVKSKEPFTIEQISLIVKGVTQKIKKYSFINLKNHTGRTILKDIKEFKKGNYLFSFRTNASQNLNERIDVEYTVNGKSISKKIKVTSLANQNNK